MAKKRQLIRKPTERHDYTVEVLGRRYAVTDMVRASQIVEHVRDEGGYGASQMGAEFTIRDGERPVGYVTYNGRVWIGDPKNWDKNICAYSPEQYRRFKEGRASAPSPITPSRVVRNNPRRSGYTQKDRYLVIEMAAAWTEKECRRLGIQCWNRDGDGFTSRAQEIFNGAYDTFEASVRKVKKERGI